MSATMDPRGQHPQNPYQSLMVPASAGSGKTYQLSRRFLFLVAAHAAPGSILTVTFTRKAAEEMRSRILGAAAALIADAAVERDFNEAMGHFHRQNGAGLAPPLAGAMVGRIILASSQLLKISTIDSLFLEWVSKFPYEADEGHGDLEGAPRSEPGSRTPFPSPFTLTDPLEARTYTDLAWRGVCAFLARSLTQSDAATQALLESWAAKDLQRVNRRLQMLSQQDTLLWYAESRRADGRGVLPLGEIDGGSLPDDERDLLEHLSEALRPIIDGVSDPAKKSHIYAALQSGSLERLLATPLLTKDTAVISGALIRGKKREALAAEIAFVDQTIRQCLDRRRTQLLNREGEALYALYRLARESRNTLKYRDHKLEFRDLAKGAYRIFHGLSSAGVRFLLSRTIHHLLLDEFQDTSRLQWAIFEEMARTLLAGDSGAIGIGARPSVFIVGDTKQSIYGFREADPAVMADARQSLRHHLGVHPLSHSFRTAQLILDYVNRVLTETSPMAEFPLHATAQLDGRPVIPNCGRILVAEAIAVDSEDDEGAQAAEEEAALLADLLHAACSGLLPSPVVTKEGTRPLRPGDCAILYRATTHAHLYEKALRQRGIPCQREEEKGYFGRPEIADLIALLHFLRAPHDLLALATVLKSPLVRIADEDLLRLLSLEAKPEEERFEAILDGLALVHAEAAQTLRHLLAMVDHILPHQLLVETFARLDLIVRWERVFRDQPGEARLTTANLLRFIELAFFLEEAGHTTLGAVLERLTILAQDDEMGNASASAHAVTLMTIHKAKGLEFPLVVVADTGRPWGQMDPYWVQTETQGDEPAALTYIGAKSEQPLSSAPCLTLREEARRRLEEETQRLLYVALTRAKQYLVITAHTPKRERGETNTAPYGALKAATEGETNGREAIAFSPRQVGRWLFMECSAGPLAQAEASHDHEEARGELSPTIGQPEGHRGRSQESPEAWLSFEWRTRSPSRHDLGPVTRRAPDDLAPPQGHGPPLTVKPWSIPSLAAPLGTLIHLGLDAFFKGHPFDAKATWSRLAPFRYRDPAHAQEAIFDLVQTLADPFWQDLRSRARAVQSECPMVFRETRSATFTMGTLDLWVTLNDGTQLVIDHKTTRFEPSSSVIEDAALMAFCQEREWDRQLADYALFVQSLDPKAPVQRGLYLTSLRRFLWLPPL